MPPLLLLLLLLAYLLLPLLLLLLPGKDWKGATATGREKEDNRTHDRRLGEITAPALEACSIEFKIFKETADRDCDKSRSPPPHYVLDALARGVSRTCGGRGHYRVGTRPRMGCSAGYGAGDHGVCFARGDRRVDRASAARRRGLSRALVVDHPATTRSRLPQRPLRCSPAAQRYVLTRPGMTTRGHQP